MRVNQNIFNQPLDQFDIFLLNFNFYSSKVELLNFWIIDKYLKNLFFNYIFNINISNLFIYLLLLFIIIFFFINFIWLKRLKLIFSSLWQYIYEEYFYKFSLNIILAQVGKKGQAYYGYITILFFYILLSNFIGLIPNSFTITSHIILTFMFGSTILIGLTIIGFMKQKLHFLQLFIPKGVPAFLLPLLVLIEIVSYIARGFSLSIRLFANLMSGHSLIHILLFFYNKDIKV